MFAELTCPANKGSLDVAFVLDANGVQCFEAVPEEPLGESFI